MYVRGKEGRTYEVEAEEAQRLVEEGEAEIVAEPPMGGQSTTTSKKAATAERRGS